MLKTKISKILLISLCGILLVSSLTGCGKKTATVETDPNATISSQVTDETKTDVEDSKKEEIRDVHDMAYYLKLQGEDTEMNFNYQGTFILGDNIVRNSGLTFRQLMQEYDDMAIEKDNTIDPSQAVVVRHKRLPNHIIMSFGNFTNAPVAMSNTKIAQVTYDVKSTTNLYSLIGEQAKIINTDISFLDSAVELFGTPVEAKDLGNNTVRLVYPYDTCVVTIDCNLTTQEGTFDIFFM